MNEYKITYRIKSPSNWVFTERVPYTTIFFAESEDKARERFFGTNGKYWFIDKIEKIGEEPNELRPV
jgi:hypothetical protein